jgi:hypothetical protein
MCRIRALASSVARRHHVAGSLMDKLSFCLLITTPQ